jgi:hypothetical protein
MEENLLTSPPEFKLYKDRAIFAGTFLGGPLVAGYLAAENFKKLGDNKKATTSWIIGIAATIVILAAAFLIPGIENIPTYIIPITYTLIAQYLVKQYQGSAIEMHIKNGGPAYTVWRAVWIGLVGAVIFFGIALLFLLLTDSSVLE